MENIENNNTTAPEPQKSSGFTLTTPAAIVIAGFLIMMGIILTRGGSAPTTNPNTDVPADIQLAPVTVDDHILGDMAKAEVVIVEYSDTECPFCKDFHVALHKAVDTHPGKIAWVYRHFPLDSIHPKARLQARATECVASLGGNDAFWKFLDIIFKETPSNNGLDHALLPGFAEQAGVQKQAFNNCFAKDTFDAKVQAQYESGIEAGAQGTPFSVIIAKDGTQIPIFGADEESLNTILDAMLK